MRARALGIVVAWIATVRVVAAAPHPPSPPCERCTLDVPTKHDGAIPLVVVLHGDRQRATTVAAWWRKAVLAKGWALLSLQCPRALGCKDSYWAWGGDPAWVAAQVAAVGTDVAIDPARVYLVGWSGGASWIGLDATAWEATFAAVVIHGGGQPPWTAGCPHVLPAYFLVGDKNPMHKLARELRTYLEQCKQDVAWDVVAGADHDGEERALSVAKAGTILDWLAGHVHPASEARSASPTARIVGARIATQVDDGPADDRPAYARVDQRVTLYAVVEVDDRGTRTTYSDAPSLQHHGRRVPTQPLARAPQLALDWKRIEPAAANYSNTDDTGFHFTAIDYRATVLADAANRASVRADVRPTLTPDHGHGVGTMRYQIVVTPTGAAAAADARPIASPGPEARRGRGSGGLTDDVTRVSIRRDDSYLGYLTEMYGQPYVWASAGITDATHQAERLEGSDCADFVVYGARRMGAKIAYTWTGGLPNVTRRLGGGDRGSDGIYRDARGVPVPFTRPGDLILFPRHVGALVEDRGTIGVVDDQDLMMHTLFDSPKTQPIADSGYADQAIEIRRFR